MCNSVDLRALQAHNAHQYAYFFGGWYRFFVGFNAPKQFLLFFRELQLYETTEATLRVPNLSTKTLSNLFLTVNSKL